MRLFTPLLLLSLNVLAVFTCSAQTISDLQKQKEQTLARISTTSQLIEEGTKSQAQNTQKLDLINSQIETRNDLIKNINQQIQLCFAWKLNIIFYNFLHQPINILYNFATYYTLLNN